MKPPLVARRAKPGRVRKTPALFFANVAEPVLSHGIILATGFRAALQKSE
jgi:hypothetical protein